MVKALTIIQRMGYSGVNIYVEYLIGLASSILIARAMLPADYGVYSYFLWLVALSTALVNAGISTGVVRFFAEARGQGNVDKLNAIDKYLRKIQFVKISILVSIFLVIYFWSPTFYLPESSQWLLLGVPVVLYCKILHMYRISILKGMECFRELAIVPIVISPINFIIILIFYLSKVELSTFLLAYFFTTGLYWLLTRYLVNNVIKTLGSTALDDQYKKRISSHLKIAGLSSVLNFLVMSQSEIAFLKWLGHADAVAFFSIAHQLSGAAMLLVPGVYSNILLPLIARSVAENHKTSAATIKLSMVYLLQMGLLVAVPVMIFAPILIDFLYGEKYQSVSMVLIWLMGFSVIKGLNATAMSYLMSVDRQSLILKVTAIFVVVTLVLDAWLIWLFGLPGAIAAYGLSAISMVIVMNILMYRLLGEKPLWRACNLTVISALISAVPIFCVVFFWHPAMSGVFLMVVGSAVYIFLYLALLCRLGAVRHYELNLLSDFFAGIGSVGKIPMHYMNYCMAKHRSNLQ
jgi:O-antigen/teichoic acid export membrane protein